MNHNNILHQYCLQRVANLQPQLIIPIYSKPIHPSNSHHIPMSYKNLDFKSLDRQQPPRLKQFGNFKEFYIQ
ncbi:unnamed protein product [Paramecium sonneborni]|uniref:Uncharacterized protein n=1 Tax=Paramecium sonneborni TaxID=65129 RepID=A0A8S1RKN7_9CILI|nr:unnamed protein product [Paramecium sonneborni]